MADLSQYVDFVFRIDNSGAMPVCVVTDVSNYPADAAGFQGFVKITQPDGISISPTFSPPDITSANLSTTKPYRLASNNELQNGIYTIIYTVKCVGYDDTVVTKTFNLSYNRQILKITPQIDVFTPSLKINDATNYSLQELEINYIIRSWRAVFIVNNQSQEVSGNNKLFDVLFNNNYYDSEYNISLISVISYSLHNYSWVEIIDKLSISTKIDVYAPLSLIELQEGIDNINTSNCNCKIENIPESKINAQGLLNEMISRGQKGDTVGLHSLEMNIEKLCFPYQKKNHSYEAIGSYSFYKEILSQIEWISIWQ